jgi:secondary thiamine-phosphate synthase enzyme
MRSIPIMKHVVKTAVRSEMIDLTKRLEFLISQQRLVDGMVIVYCPHTTAAVTINENADPDVKHDMLRKLETLVPKNEPYYRHGEGNSDSHVKTSLVGNSVMVLVEKGRMQLGRWQGIYLCEFDGPRERSLMIKFVEFVAS